VLDGINFAKDYQKDSYNNKKIIEKNIDNKKHINHTQRMFQKCFKFSKLQ
jgi:hypothetical protein